MRVIIDSVEYMDVSEASVFLKVSPSKVSKMLKAGRIRGFKDIKDERRVLIPVSDLEKLVGLKPVGQISDLETEDSARAA